MQCDSVCSDICHITRLSLTRYESVAETMTANPGDPGFIHRDIHIAIITQVMILSLTVSQ